MILVVLAALLSSSVAQQSRGSAGQTIFEDKMRNVSVEYAPTRDGHVEFSSYLPAGWSFKIDIDGDQNGAWGVGSGAPSEPMKPTPDHAFGQDERNGIFCSQYILTSVPHQPDEVYATSECGALPSRGHVEISGMDAALHATIKYVLPADELFGSEPTAKIKVCVWDTIKLSCQHSVAHPLILERVPSETR